MDRFIPRTHPIDVVEMHLRRHILTRLRSIQEQRWLVAGVSIADPDGDAVYKYLRATETIGYK